MSAEIPGQVSQQEIVEANYAVIAERDELLRQLSASHAREAELRTELQNATLALRNQSRCERRGDESRIGESKET